MKLVGSINKIEDINYIANYIDCVMLDCNIASIENLNIIISFGITPIVKFNQMIHPFEMEEIVDNIKKILNINCLIYITDLGLAYRLKKINVIDRVIYDPVTMITNSLDAKEYYSYGFNAVSLSNEITIDDVNKIVSKSDIKLFYQVFGYHLMLHSRRKLVSLYCEKINKKIELNNLTIKETTRNDIYPIVENDRGTFIYRSYLINLLKEIKNMNIEYAYLESFNLDFKKYLEVVKAFSNYINEKISLDEALKAFADLNCNDGFAYQDSVYIKEEF